MKQRLLVVTSITTVAAAAAVVWWRRDGSAVRPCGPVPVHGAAAERADVVDVFAGERSSCARLRDGSTWCWGRDAFATRQVLSPMPANVRAVALGSADRRCTLDDQGAVACSPAVGQPEDRARFRQVAVGQQVACGIDEAAAVRCWSAQGAVRLEPVLSDAVQVAVDAWSVCARRVDETVQCTAIGDQPVPAPQAGCSTLVQRRAACCLHAGRVTCTAPLQAAESLPFDGVSALAAGGQATCVLAQRAASCWSSEVHVDAAAVQRVELHAAARDLSVWSDAGCARTEHGRVECWGAGVEPNVYATRNSRPRSLAAVRADGVVLGESELCVQTGGRWSCQPRGEGSGPTFERPTRVDRPGALVLGGFTSCTIDEHVARCTGQEPLVDTARVVVSDSHACTMHTDGSVWCWGANESQQIDDSVVARLERPVRVTESASDVAVGHDFTCTLDATHGVRCRGLGGWKAIAPGRDTRGLVAGRAHACLLDVRGAVRCWTNDAPPEPVAGLPEPVVQLAAAGDHTCALGGDGRVACWGRAFVSRGGREWSSEVHADPRIVPGTHDAIALAVGTEHACLRTRRGGVECWGYNDAGQVGPELPLTTRVEHSSVDNLDCVRSEADRVADQPVPVRW